MDILQSIILGIIQGLTEFLPISSSGHLVLFQGLLGVDKEHVVLFDVIVHFATTIAIVSVFWRDVLAILKKPFGKMSLLIIVGSIPTAIIGFLFKDFFEELLQSGKSIGIEFILTGLILWFAETIRNGHKKESEIDYIDAAFMGVMQGAAILPAISRSGLTISGGLLRGLNREFAGKFSFLLSVPIISGLGLLHIYEYIKNYDATATTLGIPVIAAGFVAAALSGYFAIKFMLKLLLKKGSMKYFSFYVFILGVIILVDQFVVDFIPWLSYN